MREGLSEAQIVDLERYATSPHCSRPERLALSSAERITRSDQDVDEVLFARLQHEFPMLAAIVALTAIVAIENFRSKFTHALGIESNGFCLIKDAGGPNEERGTGP
jgi:alkylhydroperoxidase family enzyme